MIGLAPQLTRETLDAWVAAHPPRFYPPTQSLYKTITHAVISEQLPLPSMEDLEQCQFRVGDLSHAQIAYAATTDDVVPLTLRPPEIILGGPWYQTVDIWTLGALVGLPIVTFLAFGIDIDICSRYSR